MLRSSRLVPMLVVAALSALALASGSSAAPASTSCGIMSASGHTWIVVAKSVTCTKAKSVTRGLAARTAALRAGQRRVVTTALLPGFHCVLASQGKPGGSCSTAGATKSVLWIAAA
jgi:hypothetical protein